MTESSTRKTLQDQKDHVREHDQSSLPLINPTTSITDSLHLFWTQEQGGQKLKPASLGKDTKGSFITGMRSDLNFLEASSLSNETLPTLYEQRKHQEQGKEAPNRRLFEKARGESEKAKSKSQSTSWYG